MRMRASLRTLALFVAGTAVAQAQPLPAGPGMRLNTTTAGDQRNPAASTGFQGNTVAVWETPATDDDCPAIRGLRLQAGGQILGFESTISDTLVCDGGPNALAPAVAVHPGAAEFVAAWGLEPALFPTDLYEVRVRRFNFLGGALGASTAVGQDPTAVALTPGSVAFHPSNGRFTLSTNASYTGTLVPPVKLRGRTYNAPGTPLTNLFEIADGVGSTVWTPSGLLAAWAYGAPVLGVPYEVFLRRFSPAGAPLANAVTVSSEGSPDSAAVAANRAGDALVVWVADDGGRRGIYARLYDVAGNPRTGRFRVGSQTVGDGATPAVASDGASFLVAWDDAGDPSLVYARLLDANGAFVGVPFRADPFNSGTQQSRPAVAAGPEGNFLIAWEGRWPGASEAEGLDILGQRFATAAPLALGQSTAPLTDPVRGNLRYFKVDVPAGVETLAIETSGGTGNADLFVRRGSLPTADVYDRASEAAGNSERIEIGAPQAGAWYVGLRAASAYSGVTLSAAAIQPPQPCSVDSRTLCLNDARFAVTSHWRTPSGASGAGQAVRLTGDTGYFWFFDGANVELVIKVLNGCGVNGRYWVFAGGLTDVTVEIQVQDTKTGSVRTYRNAQGTPFRPIQDTGAFAACP